MNTKHFRLPQKERSTKEYFKSLSFGLLRVLVFNFQKTRQTRAIRVSSVYSKIFLMRL